MGPRGDLWPRAVQIGQQPGSAPCPQDTKMFPCPVLVKSIDMALHSHTSIPSARESFNTSAIQDLHNRKRQPEYTSSHSPKLSQNYSTEGAVKPK